MMGCSKKICRPDRPKCKAADGETTSLVRSIPRPAKQRISAAQNDHDADDQQNRHEPRLPLREMAAAVGKRAFGCKSVSLPPAGESKTAERAKRQTHPPNLIIPPREPVSTTEIVISADGYQRKRIIYPARSFRRTGYRASTRWSFPSVPQSDAD